MTKELTIDAKYRITLPEEVREHLGAKPGAQLRIREMPDGRFLIEPAVSFLDLYGSIDPKGVRATVEEMNRDIEKEAARLAGS